MAGAAPGLPKILACPSTLTSVAPVARLASGDHVRLDALHVLDLTLLKTKVESLMTEKVEATTLEVAAIRGSSR